MVVGLSVFTEFVILLGRWCVTTFLNHYIICRYFIFIYSVDKSFLKRYNLMFDWQHSIWYSRHIAVFKMIFIFYLGRRLLALARIFYLRVDFHSTINLRSIRLSNTSYWFYSVHLQSNTTKHCLSIPMIFNLHYTNPIMDTARGIKARNYWLRMRFHTNSMNNRSMFTQR